MRDNRYLRSFISSIRLLYARVRRDNLLKEASAFTYQSFLAIVPLLAVMFGIAKGFGLEQMLDGWLRREFSDHQEVLSYLLQFSQTTLKEAQGGVIAGVGVTLLLVTAIRLLSSVETTLNGMWGITYGRSLLRKTGHYLALLLTCPILLAISSSVTIFISAQFTHMTEMIPIPASAQSLLLKALALVPFATSTFLFSLLLYTLPCAPVSFRSATLSGVIAAVSFQFIQSWYILFQLRLTKVSAVYGSFVALPLFLVWLWISWLLLLLAGELLVFFQEKGWRACICGYSNSPLEKLDTDVAVMTRSVACYDEGSPLTIRALFTSPARPIRALTRSVVRLEQRGYLLQGGEEMRSAAIIPSKTGCAITICDLLLPQLPTAQPTISPQVENAVRSWKDELKVSPFDREIRQPE